MKGNQSRSLSVSWLIVQLKPIRDCWARSTAVCCFIMAYAACGPVCENDLDCDSTAGLTHCVEGNCENLPLDIGDSCNESVDCEADEGSFECVRGTCAQKPQCQQINGEFSYFVTCDDLSSAQGNAMVTTDGCVASIDLAAIDIQELALSISLPNIDASFDFAEKDLGATADGICGQSKWAATSSSLALVNCIPTGFQGSCTVVMVHADRTELPPCVLGDDDALLPCEGETTCEAVLGSSTVGLCQ